MKGRCVLPSVAIVIAALGLRIDAHAAEPARDLEGARAAYDRGAAAYDAGDYKLAASELTRADDLAPNDVALELALKAAVKADDARLAMALSKKADARQATGALASARDAARSKMAPRTGQVLVACAAGTTCTATMDGASYPTGISTYVLVGDHRVVIETNGRREAYAVRVDPFAAIDVVAKGPAMVSAVPSVKPASNGEGAREGSGLAPAWFFGAAGLTTVLGGVAIWSALDTKSKADEYALRPTEQLSIDGQDSQTRTNVLAGVVGVSAVATAVLGIFFTRWSGDRAPRATSASR